MAGHDEELRLCRLEIARLSEENGVLRISSESFGALAERLNNRLKVSEGTEPPDAPPSSSSSSSSSPADHRTGSPPRTHSSLKRACLIDLPAAVKWL